MKTLAKMILAAILTALLGPTFAIHAINAADDE